MGNQLPGPATPPALAVRVLGPLQVLRDEKEVTPKGRLQRLLLVRLLVAGGEPVDVEELAEDLFDGHPRPRHGGSALQVHVSRLRRVLVGPGDASDLILRSDTGYRLLLQDESVDTRRFERLVSTSAAIGPSNPVAVAERLAEALQLWRGPALCDFTYTSWAQPEIRRLEELRLVAAENLFDARLSLGDHHRLVPELQAMVELHPLRERLWGQLMRALYLDGRQAEALRAYQDLRRRLGEDLGLAPSPAIDELEHAILGHDPSLGAPAAAGAGPLVDAGTPHPPAVPPARLDRRLLTRFVGRQAARAELLGLLAESRLLTLTGAAGVGKTRLALEVVVAKERAEGSSVVVAELAAVTDPALVPATLAASIGVPEDRHATPLDLAVTAIGRRPMILLLDNCEHLASACAELAWELLHRCPRLRIVATSQQVLDLPVETVWAVPPLSLPGSGAADPQEVAATEAVQLFCERARRVRGGFSLNESNAGAVATICRRLDGLPLGIELAASSVAVLSVHEIAELLDDRFNLLTGGSPWVATRHQTLLGAVDWSHSLLSEQEQVLIRRLSVFAGGATVGAAEEVCAGPALPPADVFDAMAGLVGKSLVVADTAGRRARYRLLETIRCYAADRLLEAGEHAVVTAAHARWCVGLAERAEPELGGPAEREWLERLHEELDNLRSALDWAAADQQGELFLRLTAALTPLWLRCHPKEGMARLERSMTVGTEAPATLRAKALLGMSRLWTSIDDRIRAHAAAAASLELANASGDIRGQGRALVEMGSANLGSSRALSELEEGVRLAREARDEWTVCRGLAQSGWGHLHLGRPALARAPFDEALVVARARGGEPALIPILIGLAYVALFRAEPAVADGVLSEAQELARRHGDSGGFRKVLQLRAELEIGRGQYEAARSLLEQVQALVRGRWPVSGAMIECLCVMGRLALDVDDLGEARRCFTAAQRLLRQLGDRSSYVLVGLAEVEFRAGDAHSAHGLLARAAVEARSAADAMGRAEAAFHLGELARHVGAVDEAWGHHGRALKSRCEAGHLVALPASLEAVASLSLDEDNGRQAARLFAAASEFRQQQGPVRSPWVQRHLDGELDRLGAALRPAALRVAWAEGAALSIMDAVDVAAAAASAHATSVE